LSGKSKKTSAKPAQPYPLPTRPTSPRPAPDEVLGGKGLDCFVFSAAHDSDEEFLRRYGADSRRISFMLEFHAAAPAAAPAIARLRDLTDTPE
jgi:hypothetical protein